MNEPRSLTIQGTLIHSLVHGLEKMGQQVQLFETHISWIVVAETTAYKFKKAVRLQFLDFSTLDARRFYCQEELRLNRRLAPDLYIDVVAITGSPRHPCIGGPGAPIEYAVKMRTFAQEALWSHRIQKGLLGAAEMDGLAAKIAAFHREASVAPVSSEWGTPDALRSTVEETLGQIAALVPNGEDRRHVAALEAWHTVQKTALAHFFEQRKRDGYVRECHGDLHTGNILTIADRVEAFDCIEFNECLRWIDVMSDIAFIYMDLRFHREQRLATRLLNAYLEHTGDYEGLRVLRYYTTYRALVRCKVALLRAGQVNGDPAEVAHCAQSARRYFAFASAGRQPARTAIMITHGYSGCGKSTWAGAIAELVGAIRIRSDVERKRLHGQGGVASAAAALGEGLYAPASTARTYAHLQALTQHIIESGMPVIVDAAFLRTEQRARFAILARALGVPFFIVDIHASEATMQRRIDLRAQARQDASDADRRVLAHQQTHSDPLREDEMPHVLRVNGELAIAADTLRALCGPVMAVLTPPRAFDTPS